MTEGTPVAGVNSENDELLAKFKSVGVDIDDLGRRLQEQGVEAFATAWKSLLARIEETAAAPVAR